MDQNQSNKSLWVTSTLSSSLQPAFESRVTKMGRNSSERTLIMTEKHLIQKRNNKIKMLPLEFTTKFEIIRDAPILKAQLATTSKKMSVSTTGRADIVKPEDIAQLGEILFIRLSVEGNDRHWDFTGDQATLIEWRRILGTRINQLGFHHLFKVFKKIGKGNFASVYLAERVDDCQQMAIKAFSKSAVYAEENGKEGLINEIMIMRELDHPNIMKLYEVYETQNSLYMGLELLHGGQLYEYMKKKVIFQNKEIQVIMNGLVQGLAHMHQKGIMHRDLKLENILFKDANNINSVVIADFGLATFVNEPIYLYCRCGTPGFVAPEVINITDMKTTYDAVCDVYSLGLVFHILLTGKPGFPGRSYNTIVQQNKEAKINFKASVFDIVQPQALELLKLMLEPIPAKRITSKDCVRSDYIRAASIHLQTDLDNEENIDEDQEEDRPNLGCRIQKINDESTKFDMLRINQLTNSPIKSPVMQATNRMKEVQNTDQHQEMVMRTPVITGRVSAIEESPVNQQFVSPSVQLRSHVQRQAGGVLAQYTQKPGQQLPKVSEAEENQQKSTIRSVKAALNKNL